MSKKQIVYGGIVIALLLALGITIGIHMRKKQEWGILERDFDNKTEQLEEQLEDKEDEIKEGLKRADLAEEEREGLKEDLEDREKKLTHWRKRAKSKVDPITLEESKEYIVELEGANTTLKESLIVAEDEIFALRGVLKFKDEYIDLTEDKLEVAIDKNKALKRIAKKDKRMKIWTNILSGGGGLVVGVGLGKISN